jgi:hypothetical protein
MKKFGFILLLVLGISCATSEKSGISEDRIFVTRKFVGNFVGYRHTSLTNLGDPHLIWIKRPRTAPMVRSQPIPGNVNFSLVTDYTYGLIIHPEFSAFGYIRLK